MTRTWFSIDEKYVISAEDTIKETGDAPNPKMRLAIAGLKDEATKNLKMRVELAVGMRAMVVLNIATEADLATVEYALHKELYYLIDDHLSLSYLGSAHHCTCLVEYIRRTHHYLKPT